MRVLAVVLPLALAASPLLRNEPHTPEDGAASPSGMAQVQVHAHGIPQMEGSLENGVRVIRDGENTAVNDNEDDELPMEDAPRAQTQYTELREELFKTEATDGGVVHEDSTDPAPFSWDLVEVVAGSNVLPHNNLWVKTGTTEECVQDCWKSDGYALVRERKPSTVVATCWCRSSRGIPFAKKSDQKVTYYLTGRNMFRSMLNIQGRIVNFANKVAQHGTANREDLDTVLANPLLRSNITELQTYLGIVGKEQNEVGSLEGEMTSVEGEVEGLKNGVANAQEGIDAVRNVRAAMEGGGTASDMQFKTLDREVTVLGDELKDVKKKLKEIDSVKENLQLLESKKAGVAAWSAAAALVLVGGACV